MLVRAIRSLKAEAENELPGKQSAGHMKLHVYMLLVFHVKVYTEGLVIGSPLGIGRIRKYKLK